MATLPFNCSDLLLTTVPAQDVPLFIGWAVKEKQGGAAQ